MQPNTTNLVYVAVIAVLVTAFIMLGALWYFSSSKKEMNLEVAEMESKTVQQKLAERTERLQPNESPVLITPGEETLPFEFNDILPEIHELSDTGDYAAAADAFETIVDYSQNNNERAYALIKAGTFNALSSDVAEVREGVEQLGTAFMRSEAHPRRQADALLNAAQIVCGTGCNEEYFNIVFSTEPFDIYRVGNDIGHSVARLYERALALDPRAPSYVRLMSWYGEQFLTNPDLTEAQREDYKNKIVRYDDEAMSGSLDEDINRVRPQVSFYFWRGYSFGGLVAAGYAEFNDEFEGSYQQSIDLAQGSQPGDSVSEISTFAYYQYAALLHRIYGSERAADITALLNTLAEIVNADPDVTNNQFIGMIKTELETGGAHGFVGQSIFVLADAYPSFATFLGQYFPDSF